MLLVDDVARHLEARSTRAIISTAPSTSSATTSRGADLRAEASRSAR
jgi:hypothetical protein